MKSRTAKIIGVLTFIAAAVAGAIVGDLYHVVLDAARDLVTEKLKTVELPVDSTGVNGPRSHNPSILVQDALEELDRHSTRKAMVETISFIAPDGSNHREALLSRFFFCRTFESSAVDDVLILKAFVEQFGECLKLREDQAGRTWTIWINTSSPALDTIEFQGTDYFFCECPSEVLSDAKNDGP